MRKKLLFAALVLFVTGATAEAVASFLWVRGVLWPPTDTFVYEESARTVVFDPIRGYRLTGVPARFARVTAGEVCYRGVLRGNDEGFPDRDDFGPQRDDPATRRVLVLGDSFSAAQFLDCNWPDRVEDLARADGERLQLLNCSVDGGGLMNWLSIVERFVLPRGYAVDGVVVAAFDGDLDRGFHVRDDSEGSVDDAGQRVHRLGYVFSWDVDALPATLADAELAFTRTRAFVVTEAQYDAALAGSFVPVEPRPWQPFLLGRIARRFGIAWSTGLVDAERRDRRAAYLADEAGRRRAWSRFGAALARLSAKVVVVRIPSLPDLLGEDGDQGAPTRAFARAIDADYVDGAEAFAGLSAEQLRDLWFRHDHHWNQRGSDRFAQFVRDRGLAHR